jgi:hypothetical protein
MPHVAITLIEAANCACILFHFLIHGRADSAEAYYSPENTDSSQENGLGRQHDARLILPQLLNYLHVAPRFAMDVKEPPFGTSLDPRQRCTVAIVTVVTIVATVTIVVNIEILEYFGVLQRLGLGHKAHTSATVISRCL